MSSAPTAGSESGATVNSCSPRILSASRLVTSTLRCGHCARSVATSSAADMTCSKLSSISSIWRPRSCSPISVRTSSRPGMLMPTARTIASSAAGASRAGDRSTKYTPSGKRSIASAAAWRPSRVLPIPPGPVRVSSRTRADSRCSRIAARSVARPTIGVDCVGRLFGTALRLRSTGNSSGRSSATTWNRRSVPDRSRRRCSPRSRSSNPGRQLTLHRFARGIRDQHLSTVGSGHDPCRAMDIQADVVGPGQASFSRVQADA